MFKRTIMVAFTFCLVPLMVEAQQRRPNQAGKQGQQQGQQKRKSLHQEFTGQGYGMAGCGLGSIVFGDQGGMVQIIAATLNGTGNSQTFGITTGTSNCNEKGLFGYTTEYISTNKVALETDLSRGSGETLASLGALMECENSDFGHNMKSNYVEHFPQGGASVEQLGALAWKACKN